ncbi:CAP-Gly domain-containing linker protein 1-like [Chrysoperla carnea]|uniref:CAP-Gly domain-containing linker protein 1-like n=1 Tax=Chrysoperla carnea TaxID=189513 RepID=UPI001D074488|nr:CAP-Gly domain-containing linker protein 1-like [Chrysoperla carnea]
MSQKHIIPNPASTPYASKTSLQESIREKDQQISKLLRERDLDRSEVTRAASQADHAEQLLATLRKDYEKYRQECEIKLKENNGALCKLQSEREVLLGQINEEKQKAEDLQFRFEEAALHKDDVESTASIYLAKIKELENSLKEERENVKRLEKDNDKLFEAEEELTKTKVELEQLKAGKVNEESSSSDLKQENEALKQELEKLKNQNIELHSKVDNSETLYSKALLTINEHKEELEAMKAQLHKVKDELEMKTRDLCEINKKQQDDLQKENEKLQKQLESQKTEMESYVHEIKKRDSELAELTVKLEQSKHEMKLKDENIEHHVRAKRDVEEQLEQKVKEHQEILKQQEDEFEKHKIEQSKKIADAETEIIAKRATIESHASALEQLQKELSEANSQVQFVTSQSNMQQTQMQESFIQQKDMKILQMNAQFEAKCNELAHCHDVNTKQVQELHQKEAQIETYKRDFEVLYQKLRDEETMNCNLTARINEMELNVGDLSRKITSQNEMIQIITEEKRKLEMEIQQYMTHNHEYDEKLMKCSNRNNELIRQVEECRNEYNKQQQIFQHKEHEYQIQIQNLQVQLNNVNDNLNKKLQDAVNGHSVMQQKCQNDLLAAQRLEGELRAEIDRLNILLQQSNKSMQKRENDYKLQIDQLKVEIDKLTVEYQNQIKMCDVKVQHIVNENKELKMLLKQKNDMIIEMESKCKQMFNDCQSQCHGMQEECGLNIKKLNDELNHLRVTLSQREQSINELNVRMSSLKQENIQITNKLQVYNEENNHLHIQINQCKQENQHIQEELNTKSSQLNIYMQQVKQVSEEKEKIEIMLQQVHKKLEIVNQEYTQIKEQFILNRQHCANKDQHIKELEEIKVQYENQKSMLMVQIEQKESKIQELAHTIEITKQQQCVECENRIQIIQKQCDSRAMECSKMEQNIHMLQIKINDMSIECNRAKSEITIWQQEYEKVKNQSNTIEQHCSEKDTLILDLRGEIQILKEHHEQQSNHRIELLEQQINQYKVQFNEYQQQCDIRSHELEECKNQIIVIKETHNKEQQQQVVIVKQQYEQLQNTYHTLQVNCEKRQQEVFNCKQEVQQTQHHCSETQNKLVILEKKCTEVQHNFGSLKQRCENNIINLKICQEQLKNRVQHPPTQSQPIIQQSCDNENRQITLLQQQIQLLQRGVCDVNRICTNLNQNDIDVQRFCHSQIVQINQLQVNLEQCKNNLQLCHGHQQDSVKQTSNCANEKHVILNQCNEQKRQLEIQITQLQQENLKFIVVQKELEQSKLIIHQLQQEGEHRCDLLKLTVQQKENEIMYLHDIIQQLHVINNSTSQNNKHCKMLELTIKQNQVELTQKIQLINELRVKIDGLLKLQNDVQRCSVLELQLQQKQLEIDTQAQLIIHLRKVLEDLQFGGNQQEHNVHTFRAEIDKLNTYLHEKDQMIFKLQTKLQQCERNSKVHDEHRVSIPIISGANNCGVYVEEISRLQTELHWSHVHATEFENKFHLLVTENQQLLEKLRQCVDGCHSHSMNVTIPNNWEIEKLTLLEQIAELKCELETRAKELIICKTKIPCKSKSAEIAVDLDIGSALEQAHQEKFTNINNKLSSVGGAIGSIKQKAAHVIQSRDEGSSAGGWQQITQANQQIQFLNSIIVDMQQKNEQLRSKIEALEATCAPNSSSQIVWPFNRRL